MIKCPTCGTENEPGSRFCMNCGADLTGVNPTPPPDPPETEQPIFPPTPTIPPSFSGSQPAGERTPVWQAPIAPSSELPPTSPEWKMSSSGPLPDPPRRRRWLWILLIVIVALLLLCCVALILGGTVFEDRLTDFATRVSREATESAR